MIWLRRKHNKKMIALLGIFDSSPRMTATIALRASAVTGSESERMLTIELNAENTLISSVEVLSASPVNSPHELGCKITLCVEAQTSSDRPGSRWN